MVSWNWHNPAWPPNTGKLNRWYRLSAPLYFWNFELVSYHFICNVMTFNLVWCTRANCIQGQFRTNVSAKGHHTSNQAFTLPEGANLKTARQTSVTVLLSKILNEISLVWKLPLNFRKHTILSSLRIRRNLFESESRFDPNQNLHSKVTFFKLGIEFQLWTSFAFSLIIWDTDHKTNICLLRLSSSYSGLSFYFGSNFASRPPLV